jgi:thiol-disulfide isomerase/thioredoxin
VLRLFVSTLAILVMVFHQTGFAQNNPGRQTNDFNFFKPSGQKARLYAIKADYTLVFFYNPECEACKTYRAMLANSSIITRQVKSGRLKVLAIYVDKDIALWKRHLPEMPGDWINGRDSKDFLFKNKVYDLHAIPTIYLLDKIKKVILKDVLDVKQIEINLH